MTFPIVVIILIVIIEFARLWSMQATISDAARISARYASIHSEDATVVADAQAEATAVPGLVDWSTATVGVTVDCDGTGSALSVISVDPGSITTWFANAIGSSFSLTATGEMPCGG